MRERYWDILAQIHVLVAKLDATIGIAGFSPSLTEQIQTPDTRPSIVEDAAEEEFVSGYQEHVLSDNASRQCANVSFLSSNKMTEDFDTFGSPKSATSHIARACSIILSKLKEPRKGCPYIDNVFFNLGFERE